VLSRVLRCGLVKGVSTGARPTRVGIIDREALLLDGVHEIDGRAAEIRRAHPIGYDSHTAELLNDVSIQTAVIEEELVAKS
jgi:hypothetical protein